MLSLVIKGSALVAKTALGGELSGEVGGLLLEEGLSSAKEALLRGNATARIKAADAREDEHTLAMLTAIVIQFARRVFGQDVSRAQALEYLLQAATDDRTVRRFRALILAAAVSEDDKVAMLGTGYLVGAQTELRDRVERALRDLFPDDVGVLESMVDHLQQPGAGMSSMRAVEIDSRGGELPTWYLSASIKETFTKEDALAVPMHALHSLQAAQCVSISTGVKLRGNPVLVSSGGGNVRQVMYSLKLLPVGRELVRVLGTLDWREIPRNVRRPSPPG